MSAIVRSAALYLVPREFWLIKVPTAFIVILVRTLRLISRGKAGLYHAQDPSRAGCFMYDGGHTYLESVPIESGYADVIFRLSEKTSSGVSIKYLLPGEDLRPENLITISDNADLQVISVSSKSLKLRLQFQHPNRSIGKHHSYRHLSAKRLLHLLLKLPAWLLTCQVGQM